MPNIINRDWFDMMNQNFAINGMILASKVASKITDDDIPSNFLPFF